MLYCSPSAAVTSVIQTQARTNPSLQDRPHKLEVHINSPACRERYQTLISASGAHPTQHRIFQIQRACTCAGPAQALPISSLAINKALLSSAEPQKKQSSREQRSQMLEGAYVHCPLAGCLPAGPDRDPEHPYARCSVGPLAVLYPATASCDLDGVALLASKARLQRLTLLCLLRKLYRNMLRAENLLQQPAPIHPAPQAVSGSKFWQKRAVRMASIDEDDEEAVEQRDAAVQLVAEMQLTAEQLRVRWFVHSLS